MIFPILALIFAAGATALGQAVTILPSSVPQVEITDRSAAAFRSMADRLLTEASVRGVVEPALPYSVLVTNASSRAITYYVIRFDYLNRAGKGVSSTLRMDRRARRKVEARSSEIVFPILALTEAAVDGNLPRVASGMSNTISRVLANFAQSPQVVASVDSVVYEDGEFLGQTSRTHFLY